MRSGTVSDARKRMDKAADALAHEFAGLRTGRASVALFDHIRVDYYGTPTPVNQLSTLSAPEPRLITIQPWDTTQIHAIEKAILSSDLGLNPSNDGKMIRIAIPQLTEERRKELVKVAKRYSEEGKVAIRNIRRDANEGARKLEKDKEISQDDLKKLQQEIQDATDEYIKKVDALLEKKEKDIMEV
ncbi:MAG TPA: ribosome recycling factor [Thermodesulfobacteriota bacterium]|nr:ribosome recycling factor [Thermodesulfobacteriota bacterium]